MLNFCIYRYRPLITLVIVSPYRVEMSGEVRIDDDLQIETSRFTLTGVPAAVPSILLSV